jgi:hypothetical protein
MARRPGPGVERRGNVALVMHAPLHAAVAVAFNVVRDSRGCAMLVALSRVRLRLSIVADNFASAVVVADMKAREAGLGRNLTKSIGKKIGNSLGFLFWVEDNLALIPNCHIPWPPATAGT